MYGLAFHPDFERNRQCFLCYTLRGADGRPNLADGTRVSRFRVTPTDPPRVNASSEEILLSFLQGGHNGGDLQFGTDGMLYISTGDAAPRTRPTRSTRGRTSPTCSPPSCGSMWAIRTRARITPSPRTIPSSRSGAPAGSLGIRPPQPLADELRSPDRRAMRGGRRLGVVGNRPSRREGGQLRVVGDGGAPADQVGADRADADPPAAVSQRIIENHGGTIEVRSQPGEGATFTVLLPIEADAYAAYLEATREVPRRTPATPPPPPGARLPPPLPPPIRRPQSIPVDPAATREVAPHGRRKTSPGKALSPQRERGKLAPP